MVDRIALAYKRACRRHRPTGSGRHPIRGAALATLLLTAAMALTFISLLELRLRPVVEQLAVRQVENHVTAHLNTSLGRLVDGSGELFSVRTDTEGEVLVLSGDMEQLDRIRAKVVDAALATLEQAEVHTLGVPLGSLFDFDLLWAKGPVVEVHCLVAGTVSTQLRSEFQSAGINQTLHRILLDVNVPLTVLLPGSRAGTVARLTLCAAETVIVGKVPQTYLDLNGTGGEEHGRKTGDPAAAAGTG